MSPKIILGQGVALFGRLAIPLQCLNIVLRHAPAFIVQDSEIVLGNGLTLFGSLVEPFDRFSVVLRDALTRNIHDPKIVLGICVTLRIRRRMRPLMSSVKTG